MSKLDADFSGWLRANQAQFPKTIWQLVQLACQRAGVALASSSLPINGSYSVQAFYADDLTCRQIISWAAEAAGCYAPHECRRQAAILDPTQTSAALLKSPRTVPATAPPIMLTA